MAFSPELDEIIAALPKIELHLHIEGTLEPEMAFAMAERNGVELPYGDVDSLRAAYRFRDLQSFLDVYYAGCAVLQTERDFYDLTRAYLRRAAADNVVHAEIFFDPQSHTARGVALEAVVGGIRRALDEAREEDGVTSELILCFLRHLTEEDAFATLEAARPLLADIVGVGLDSAEAGNPPSKFERVFAAAGEAGLRRVAHAGEEGPAAYVRDALDLLGAERIDHGVRCTEDRALVERLVRDRVPLTVCPLSNVALRVFDTLAEHNLKELLDRGLCVSVHSDDPAYFGGYIGENYRAICESLPIGRQELARLAENAIDAAFITEERRAALREDVRRAAG